MKKLYEETDVQAIADAIRKKTGKTDKMKIAEMSGEIEGIDTGYNIDDIALKTISGDIFVTANELKSYAFCLCYELTGITAPNVTKIGNLCFSNDTSLLRCDFSQSLTFNDRCFYNCNCLTAFIMRSKELTQLSSNQVFQYSGISNGTGYIYVPSALVDSYKTATNWSVYADQFRALEDYTVDGTTTGELDESKI